MRFKSIIMVFGIVVSLVWVVSGYAAEGTATHYRYQNLTGEKMIILKASGLGSKSCLLFNRQICETDTPLDLNKDEHGHQIKNKQRFELIASVCKAKRAVRRSVGSDKDCEGSVQTIKTIAMVRFSVGGVNELRARITGFRGTYSLVSP